MYSLRMATAFTALAIISIIAYAQFDGFPDDCRERTSRLRDWKPAAPHLAGEGVSPGKNISVMTIGDFDGDGQPDLVVLGTSDGRQVLAVCRSNWIKSDSASKKMLHRLGLLRGSCNDSVYKVKAGSRVSNLYGREVELKTDAFATSCLTTTERRIFIYERDRDFFGNFLY